MERVKLVSITPDVEKLIAYCARISSPQNQDNFDTAPKLLRYCIRKGHWSIFEMANMVVEIETSRAIAAQILRHRSFTFQEFSQRYAAVTQTGVAHARARRQDTKNRQNSFDDLSSVDVDWFDYAIKDVNKLSREYYEEALSRGIAKECARFLLPLATKTRMYMNGTIRSWIHYIQLRTAPETQLEHRQIAEGVRAVFSKELPIIAEALEW